MNSSLLVWILLFPLIGALLNGGFYLYHIKVRKIPEWLFALIGTLMPLFSFISVAYLFVQMQHNNTIYETSLYHWLDLGKLHIGFGLMIDHLSVFMTLFVIFVGLLIHIYAVGYMRGDEGFGKFFAFFNLFLGSMVLLVLADNPIVMFLGWEGVGLCSYLLISFYYQDGDNVMAGNKAFIVNRVGDLGFLLGIITLFVALGEVDMHFTYLESHISNASPALLSLSALFLFVGAMGKSAQIPLYIWLPDAMAGPTPISALIHAATMVTAGVYMVSRFHFLYARAESVGLFIAYVGAFSALLAAIIATRQQDIKKILAYSTISQLGYMFIAVGLGFYSTGLFHVLTHAFFKAMLFMGAGGVIIALHHEQNIFKIGQNRVKLPVVSFTFLVGVLAISGIPPFSGFFSKDAILSAAFMKGEYLIWVMGMFTAFLTAYYMFRLYLIVFVTPNKTPHTPYVYTPPTITIPLMLLAVGAALAGFLNLPEIFGGEMMVDNWLADIDSHRLHLPHSTEWALMLLSVSVAVAGVYVAYAKYRRYDLSRPESQEGWIGNKFYIDEAYDMIFVRPLKALSVFIDKWLDGYLIDGFIVGTARLIARFGNKVAILQNANVRFYTLFMFAGMMVVFVVLYFSLEV